MILVSGCLLGIRCRYDGRSKPNDQLMRLARRARLIPVCPEQLGGLPTPRPAASIRGGDGFDVLSGSAKVLTVEGGNDVTRAFVKGAMECERLARLLNVSKAILKGGSPSCGTGLQVGVAAAALILLGIEVTEAD